MFKILIDQAKRHFSAKQNAGKQVPKLTDRLHAIKQIVLLLSIILILGYSQFRAHFYCQPIAGVDKNIVTNFCWINGTYTVIEPRNVPVSHAGLGFATTKNHVQLSHNYMRSLWALLIVLASLSYFAQRKWSSIFDNDILRALLQLSGTAETRLVQEVESVRPYELLTDFPRNIGGELKKNENYQPPDCSVEKMQRLIDIVDNYVNIYDRSLDYYPNQLIYLLLTKNSVNYKLSCLKLRHKLIKYSCWSALLTLMQLLVPLIMIGNKYLFYGLNYLEAFIDYLVKISKGANVQDSSIDYQLSARIFPIATQCKYSQYGMGGSGEQQTVQCTVAINEIASKMFALIWWIVAVSLLCESISLLTITICSLNARTIAYWFGLRYWPHSRAQANLIATFRYRRAVLLKRCELIRRCRESQKGQKKLLDANLASAKASCIDRGIKNESTARDLIECDKLKKKLEAEHQDEKTSSCAHSHRHMHSEQWYRWCSSDLGNSLVDKGAQLICCKASHRRERQSKSRVEEVIIMTEKALRNYLEDLELHCEQEAEKSYSDGCHTGQLMNGTGQMGDLSATAMVLENPVSMC